MALPVLDTELFDKENALLERLDASATCSAKSKEFIGRLRLVREKGFAAALEHLTRKQRSDARKAERAIELTELVSGFNSIGAASVCTPSAARAGDFLINLSRGQWAEDVLAEGLRQTARYVYVTYGPSTPPMPGEGEYLRKVGIFSLITTLEGKRPDGLLIPTADWNTLTPELQHFARHRLSETPEDGRTEKLIEIAVAGVEVKSSVWLAKKRKEGTISVTLKSEEIEPFDRWQEHHCKPILFVQVFFDSLYVLNYRTMKEAAVKGTIDGFNVEAVEEGDEDRKTRKGTHKFPLANARRFGDVPFPDRSEARFMIVGEANVAPYILYKGDPATDLNIRVLEAAIEET